MYSPYELSDELNTAFMKQSLKVLIIEDHPFIIEGYINALNFLSSTKNFDLSIDSANNCDNALLCIESALKTKFYDLIFLDIRIPPSENRKILCGEDLGVEIRKISDETKIIISTGYDDNFRLNNIIKTVDPDGFLVKVDVNFNIIIEAIETVLKDPPYYSKLIIKFLRQQISNGLVLDNIDRQILYQISIGTKTKDLPKIIPLSIAGIERRKRRLKIELRANSKDDFGLVQIAKEKGFI